METAEKKPAWKPGKRDVIFLALVATVVLTLVLTGGKKTTKPTPDDLIQQNATTRAQWLVLAAAFLGWMFDGVEMGIFPLVARPALHRPDRGAHYPQKAPPPALRLSGVQPARRVAHPGAADPARGLGRAPGHAPGSGEDAAAGEVRPTSFSGRGRGRSGTGRCPPGCPPPGGTPSPARGPSGWRRRASPCPGSGGGRRS